MIALEPATPGVRGDVPFELLFVMPILLLVWLVMIPVSLFAMATFSGWRRLAAEFRGAPLEGADAYVMQSARINAFGSYKSVLKIRVSEAAFSVVLMLPFGFFHDLLVIPWTAVATVEMESGIYRKGAHVTLAGRGDDIIVAGTAGRAVFEAFQRYRAR
jgi:hypothetical protein